MSACVNVCACDGAYVVCMHEQVCMCVGSVYGVCMVCMCVCVPVCMWRPWPLLVIAGH